MMNQHAGNEHRQRGVTAVLVAVTLVLLFSMAALTIDLGRAYVAKGELQASADSAAMAGAWDLLLNEERIYGDAEALAAVYAARAQAKDYGEVNWAMGEQPGIELNAGNAAAGDIVFGQLIDQTTGELSFTDPTKFNAVLVRSWLDDAHQNSLQMLFAPVFGKNTTNIGTSALAAFLDGVTGFQVTDTSGNAQLLPLALNVDRWNQYLAGTYSHGDSYTYDSDSGNVSNGGDGVPELNLYPGSGGTQLPPGNFGTVDIGSSNNSTSDIARQIVEGVNESDLAYLGGSLELNDDGFVLLNGDTGLSAGIKDDLESIKGDPRIIPLFTTVTGPGNNAMFKVVGFAGIRIVHVKLTGPMNQKAVRIQPAVVVDPTVITTEDSDASYHVYAPVRLIR